MGSVHLSLSANAVKSPNSASVLRLVAERELHQDPQPAWRRTIEPNRPVSFVSKGTSFEAFSATPRSTARATVN